jgi:hypothetical protein
MKMRANKWIPIVEDMPKINEVILLEFGGNEYLGPPYHTVVLPAYLTQCEDRVDRYWTVFTPEDSPYPSQMGVSSGHIWSKLPMDSCEIVYWDTL